MTIDYKYRYLLDDWQKEAVEVLNEKFREQLRATDDVLMDFAEKAESGAVQNHFFDAQREIWLKMEDMSLDFHDLLTKHLSRFPATEEPTSPTLGNETLSLVNIDLYERNLALNTLAEKAEKANYQELYLLAQRLSVINNGRPVAMGDIPAAPKQMCEIFARCVNRLTIENDALLVLYTLYDKYVLSALPELHEKLNQSLIKAGILPTLKYSVKNQGGGRDSAYSEPADRESEPVRPETPGTPTPGGQRPTSPSHPQTPEELGAETMQRIHELLKANRLRRKRAPLPPGVTVASRQEVLQAANTVTLAQAGSFPDSEMLFEPVGEERLHQVQQDMAVQRETIKNKIGQNRLQDQQEDVIDLVGMLFEQMLDDDSIPNAAKALFGHLHTPYIKIGLDDEDFLDNPQHPARVFLDKAVAAASVWVDEADLKKGLYPFLKDVVYNIVRLRQQNREDFEHHIRELDDQVSTLERKFAVVEQRTVENEQGKEQLFVAKKAARKATGRIFGKQKIPAFCKKFIDEVWVDYLTLLQLRGNGDENDLQWQEALTLGRRILELCASDRSGLGHTAQVETVAGQIRNQITALLPHQERKINAFIDALYDPKSTGATDPVEVPPPPTEETASEPPSDQKLLELYQELRALPQDTWFEFESGTEQAHRAKLSWYNPLTDHFLFVMPRGRQSRLVEIGELAREIQEGHTRYFTNLKSSFWSRAMRSIMSALERKDKDPSRISQAK